MSLTAFERLGTDEAMRVLLACCGSRAWARRMAQARPFESVAEALDTADLLWEGLEERDWREAFAAHPRIGDRASGAAAREQSGTRAAPPAVLDDLARANREYEDRFGHIFIVCAAGKTAEEMLAICRSRLHNDAATEHKTAAEEQRKITRLRLERYLAT